MDLCNTYFTKKEGSYKEYNTKKASMEEKSFRAPARGKNTTRDGRD